MAFTLNEFQSQGSRNLVGLSTKTQDSRGKGGREGGNRKGRRKEREGMKRGSMRKRKKVGTKKGSGRGKRGKSKLFLKDSWMCYGHRRSRTLTFLLFYFLCKGLRLLNVRVFLKRSTWDPLIIGLESRTR